MDDDLTVMEAFRNKLPGFKDRALHIEPDETLPNARRWHQAVSARPSATA
ncbi:MAG: hypothetical protein U5L11_17640 [Arhodomonas sp.]|nr:hypothetical protein [Arhodomonas sp.]